jgi:addiction module RelE/StbE family toxin
LWWSPRAQDDLDEACSYIAADNPHAATRIENRIVETVSGLLAHPRKGRARPDGKARELVVPGAPYLVIYRIGDDTIEIMRVWHTSREPYA